MVRERAAVTESTKAQLKRLRRQFREQVFDRDGHRCVTCGATANLDAHHITDRSELANDGYAASNGITLCGGDSPDSCHWKAEAYHRGGKREWVPEFHPDDLYARIGSSAAQARRDSEGLR